MQCSQTCNQCSLRRYIMETYTFNAYGVTWSEEHGTYTRAIQAATKELLWKFAGSRDGAWFQKGITNELDWVEGDFWQSTHKCT